LTQKGGVCAVWIISLKAARNRHNRSTAGSGRTCTSRTAENIGVVNDLVLPQSEGCTRDTQNYPSDFAEVSVTHHTQRYPAQVQKRLKHGRESNIASL